MANKDYPKPRLNLVPTRIALQVRTHLGLPPYSNLELMYYKSRLGSK